MLLCWNARRSLIDRLRPDSSRLAFLRIAGCLLLASALPGCASLSLVGSERIQPTPAVASAPPHVAPPHVAPPHVRAATWSSRTQAGREALVEPDLETAEAHLFSALERSTSFRSTDVRVDVSFGNLVRLAAVYARVGRLEDSKRVMAAIETEAGLRRIEIRRIGKYRARYEALVASPRNTRLAAKNRSSAKNAAPYDRLIRNTADSFDIDPALVKAVVAAESNFEPRAVSRVGAQGLMQLMPGTARAMGVRRPFAPSDNIRGGVRYLRTLLDRFDELGHALAAYNAGPDAVVRHGGIPPYPETEAYVTKVLSKYRRYQKSFSQ
jgi:soluble lytic murein transglycosylase-like protein